MDNNMDAVCNKCGTQKIHFQGDFYCPKCTYGTLKSVGNFGTDFFTLIVLFSGFSNLYFLITEHGDLKMLALFAFACSSLSLIGSIVSMPQNKFKIFKHYDNYFVKQQYKFSFFTWWVSDKAGVITSQGVSLKREFKTKEELKQFYKINNNERY